MNTQNNPHIKATPSYSKRTFTIRKIWKDGTIYLNTKTSQGIETVDEFTRESEQSSIEFRKYVNEMKKQYLIAGIETYKSSRSTNEWKQK